MNISQHIPDDIKRAARAIGYAAWLDTPDEWLGLSVILRARLSDEQRAALAYQALRSLDYDHACSTADAALGVALEQGAGQPIAPLFNYMDEAAFWADMAEQDERDAYMLAAFERSPTNRRTAFLGFVQGRKIA